jgi:pimeloyl-ACP methyl ester carboxylesterase
MIQNRREILTVGGLLAIAASTGLGSPARATASPQGQGSLPGRKIELNGIPYHVSDRGRGDNVVLLLHGMPDTSGVWRHQVEAITTAGYRVIVPDMLGYGETAKPAEAARYVGEKILADMITLLDTLAIPRVDIIGHDWGAYASWELALAFPQRFRRHVTLSVGHPDSVLAARSIDELKTSWYMYFNTQASTAELYAANDGEWLRTFFLPTHPELDEVWSRMKDPAAMRGMLNWDCGNPMSGLYLAASKGQIASRPCSVPTLGLWSTGDTYLWESQMTQSAKAMSAPWRYERIEGGSHWLQLDRPHEVSSAILKWLTQG